METVQAGSKRNGVSLIGALAGMLVTFIAGVFVGLHPAWIPIKGAGSADNANMPLHAPAPGSQAAPIQPVPATEPTTRGV